MKKTTPKKEAKPDIGKAVSVMGVKKFNEEIKKEILGGTPPGEAADLIARRKLKGMI